MNATNKIKIALVGYGAMGKEIEDICISKKHIITNKFDIDNPLNQNQEYDFDVAIDFSNPDSVIKNIEILSSMRKYIVVGTTNWYDKIDYVKQLATDNDIGIVWGSNFSIGMQVFYKIVKCAAELFNDYEQYDTFISEIHHSNKADSPSGSAKTLSNIILENFDKKKMLVSDNINRKIAADELHISSLRGGSIYGQHNVFFDSQVDTIQLIHNAKSRKGFAIGAVTAAEFINNRTGFYNFEEILFG